MEAEAEAPEVGEEAPPWVEAEVAAEVSAAAGGAEEGSRINNLVLFRRFLASCIICLHTTNIASWFRTHSKEVQKELQNKIISNVYDMYKQNALFLSSVI